MNNENKVIIVLGAAIVVGMVLGVILAQKISGEIKEISSGIKNLETSMKGIDSSIKGVDSSVKEVKTSLAEKEIALFRRNMQENGRRMLALDYAGKFAKWDAAKEEVEEIDKNLENAADKKDTGNFEKTWTDAYNACVGCHQGVLAPSSAFEALREISSEVEQLSG